MPFSRNTSATPEIIASVFFDLRRISTPSAVRSGTMSAEELGVLDLPGHHRLGDAGVLEQVHPGAQAVRARRGGGRRRGPRGRGLEVGKGFFLERDDRDVVAGAARGIEDEKREPAVAGDQTEAGHWPDIGGYSSASTSSARRVARRRITPRSDERMKSTTNCTSGQLSERSRSIWRMRVGRVQLRLQQISERPLQLRRSPRTGCRAAADRWR